MLRSWIESANNSETDFPLNNLPCGVFSACGIEHEAPRCCTALGDFVIDLRAMERDGWFGSGCHLLVEPSWNAFMEAGAATWSSWRHRMQALFAESSEERDRLKLYLHPLPDIQLHMPFRVAGFTDFFSSYHHAMNVGTLARGPEKALTPNWLHAPIGYNGRSSAVVVTGSDIRRPMGQIREPGSDTPVFAASRCLDIEVELGAVIGSPSSGRVDIARAEDMIFGFVLLNDWSSRDIQAWESQPLGPFQSKTTASTIGAWIVMKEALQEFRRPPPDRIRPLLDYLTSDETWVYDIRMLANLIPAGGSPNLISDTNYRYIYYTFGQQLCHHTTSGCPMQTGDLLGSGTISGPHKSSCGSLLELSEGGKVPLILEDGQVRTFLEDGDLVSIHGYAQAEEFRIGFGLCEGRVLMSDA